MSPRLLFVALLSCVPLGCGGATDERAALAPPAGESVNQPQAPPEKKDAAGADPAVVGATPQAQMIVYTVTLDVVVKDLDLARAEVEKLVAGHKGFVARSEVRGDPGSPRYATFTLRMPVAAFSPLKEGLLALGTAERNAVETQDVTEEYVDVEARIKNLQEQERKLNELLQEKRKEEKLEDIIRVSDRIYVVRGDIERAQGRRKYLLNRVQLSTINLTLREIKDYKPPTAPTFGVRIRETFASSWEAVVDFGQRIVLLAVALTPWTPLWLPLVLLGAWGIRRLIRLSRESARSDRFVRPHRAHPAHVEPPEDTPSPSPTEPTAPPEGEAHT